MDEIRLKFVGHLGKFENLETFDFLTTEIHSRMNDAANDDTFKTEKRISPNEAFEDELPSDNPDDVPF